MRQLRGRFQSRSLVVLIAGALVGTLPFAPAAAAQGRGAVIDAGTTINVRTTETIKADSEDGRIFNGVVDEDVLNRNRGVAIPKGSDVELTVKKVGEGDVSLDLDAVVINGTRYGVEAEDNLVESERKEGVGANERTGKYVGGGAVLGAIIGAIAGGGKGAAIGAGVGAGAGAGAQVLTRGKSVDVPTESLLTFRLAEPLRAGIGNNRIMTREGRRYRLGVGDNNQSEAYREGMRNGRSDADRNLPRNAQTTRWTNPQDRRDYESGYSSGYQPGSQSGLEKPGVAQGGFTVNVARNNNVTWQGPANAQVFVQVDNEPAKLFAAGQSGTLAAPWISQGHVYVFTLRDAKGNEIGRDEVDMRATRGRPEGRR